MLFSHLQSTPSWNGWFSVNYTINNSSAIKFSTHLIRGPKWQILGLKNVTAMYCFCQEGWVYQWVHIIPYSLETWEMHVMKWGQFKSLQIFHGLKMENFAKNSFTDILRFDSNSLRLLFAYLILGKSCFMIT